jgi:hypothetical protein
MADSDTSQRTGSTGPSVSSKSCITVNGRTYDSVDQMPPEVRAEFQRAMSMLADRDGNGIPDILEGKASEAAGQTSGAAVVQTSTRFTVNGQHYDRWENVPEKYRMLLAKAGHAPPGVRDSNDPALTDTGDGPDAATPQRIITFPLTGPRLVLVIFAIAVLATIVMWLLRPG